MFIKIFDCKFHKLGHDYVPELTRTFEAIYYTLNKQI